MDAIGAQKTIKKNLTHTKDLQCN